ISPRVFDLPIVHQTADATVYRNDQVLPRARIASNLADNMIDTSAPGSSIQSLTDSGNTVTIRAVSPANGYLILADTYYPGWHALVDGTPTPIELANTAFRAVKLSAGEHVIEFRYEPASVKIGAAITIVCGVIVLIGLTVTRQASRRASAKRGRA
ncbi:MAG: YfhO family protein, partial [Chloroflexi bacterium]|nr:YfhO family protein [Chloroflexota bacterium]